MKVRVRKLPPVCARCQIPDCWECDYAMLRFPPTKEEDLNFKKALRQKAIERYQREIAEIDRELQEIAARKEGVKP